MREDFPVIPTSGNDEQYSIAIERICDQCRFHLYGIALKVVKSPQTASDIVQNVFLKLWENRTRLSTVNNIEAWLYTIAKNELVDFLRKTAADNRLKNKLWEQMQAATSATEELVDFRLCNHILEKAVNRLPPQRKLIYTLNRDNGLTYRQIAEKLSLSTHTVKNHLSLALRSIQRFVSGSLYFILIYFAG